MYSKNWIIILLLVSILVLAVSGCKAFRKKELDLQKENDAPGLEEEGLWEDEGNTRETILFYQDDAGYLVPIMRRIEWEEGIAKAALLKLVDAPEQQQEMLGMGLKSLLPVDTQINGISIKDGLAKVDFNEAAMNYSDALTESNMVQGVVMTLVEFPAIERVQLMFDGKIVDTLKYGTEVGAPIGPERINVALSLNSPGDGAEVTVFYCSTSPSRYEYLVPVTRITSQPSATIETAMEELLQGPKPGSNLHLEIPEGVKMLGVQMDDGITYLNFSKELESLRQSENEMAVLKAITMTAREFTGVSAVKLLVEGNEYGDGQPMVMSAFANEF